MIMSPVLIVGYPRSGSTWLRFILCNTLYSGVVHDFASVNYYIPTIEDCDSVICGHPTPLFYKTHQLRHAKSVVFLHRHVGDVLVSEYFYKKKFYQDDRSFEEFLLADDVGKGWRDSVDHYFPCPRTIRYDHISNPDAVLEAFPSLRHLTSSQIREAMDKSSFKELQKVEQKGFGNYPTGDPAIKFFRQGTSKQWATLDEEFQEMILEKNSCHLRLLGYS
jgi:hypothetical protein